MRRPLQLLLGVVGLLTVALAVEAVYLWAQQDEAGSLALATAVATFALAFAAILTIAQNAALVQAAVDEAKASADEARASRETVDEMQRQRELAYRPWLVVNRQYIPSPHAEGRSYVGLRVVNIGSGPAVDIVLSGVSKKPKEEFVWAWMTDTIQGLAPGDHWDVTIRFRAPEVVPPNDPRPDRYRCLTDDLATQVEKGTVVAVRYRDLFGTHYRSSPDSTTTRIPEEWRGASTAADAPNWLRCE
jgi:hypothetical protein